MRGLTRCHPVAPQGVARPCEQPRIRVGGQLPGVEQPDVEARQFSACTLPLVWWPPGCALNPLCLRRWRMRRLSSARQDFPHISSDGRTRHSLSLPSAFKYLNLYVADLFGLIALQPWSG